MATLDDTAAPVAEKSVESSASAVEWASIFGGALAAFGVTIILMTLGPGLGLATTSPWSFTNPSPTTFGTAAAIWLIVTQWLSSAFGGYLAGRLRTKWVGIRTARSIGLGIGNTIDCGTRYTRLGRDCGSGCGRSDFSAGDPADCRGSRAGTQNRRCICIHDIAFAPRRSIRG